MNGPEIHVLPPWSTVRKLPRPPPCRAGAEAIHTRRASLKTPTSGPRHNCAALPLQVHAITARLSPASKATQQGRIEKGIALVFQVSPPQAERELADGNAGDFLQAQARVEQAIVVDDIGL